MKKKQQTQAFIIASLQLQRIHQSYLDFKYETFFSGGRLPFDSTYETHYLSAFSSERYVSCLIGTDRFAERFKKFAFSIIELAHYLKKQCLPIQYVDALHSAEVYILRLLSNQLPESKQLELITSNLPTFNS